MKFETVAGPFDSPANGVVWDGEAVLFALREEQRLMRLDPASGEVTE
ncbi:MAG: SMP-30/gluconolactonase/LRE family protein, partial [Rhodospirillaceae bacterium]|nr:SMP-30/gluconolactonase/LRE family protein [Rhodospirillaceae bacterium]MBT6535204.1 SMP-30/gluconolactonase/LRE family protein [Rhodospirillaceae bacterium]